MFLGLNKILASGKKITFIEQLCQAFNTHSDPTILENSPAKTKAGFH